MMKLLGNLKKGLIFVLSAPAGTGKTTLVENLVKKHPCLIQSISYTTRKKRRHEKSGDHYHFLSVSEFEKKIAEHEFLEYVLLYGDYYGTSKKWVEEQQNNGKHVILVIDTQGAIQLMDAIDATFIFMSPPSLAALEKRLVERGTETEESKLARLKVAEKELEAACYYDYHIINDDFETAAQVFLSILIAEEHKTRVQ